MQFLDWNGSGGLDPQDIATTVGMGLTDDEPESGSTQDGPPEPSEHRSGSSSSGCLPVLAGVIGAVIIFSIIITSIT